MLYDIDTDGRAHVLRALDDATSALRSPRQTGLAHRATMSATESMVSERAADIRRRLVNELAARRGWSVAGRHFSVDQLRHARPGKDRSKLSDSIGDFEHPYLDHLEWFRQPHKPYRPAAMLSHSYAEPDDIEAWCRSHGFAYEFLPWSWYFPGRCSAFLIARDYETLGHNDA